MFIFNPQGLAVPRRDRPPAAERRVRLGPRRCEDRPSVRREGRQPRGEQGPRGAGDARLRV
eukprot:3733370-Pyramimonas_sp.AAC.1